MTKPSPTGANQATNQKTVGGFALWLAQQEKSQEHRADIFPRPCLRLSGTRVTLSPASIQRPRVSPLPRSGGSDLIRGLSYLSHHQLSFVAARAVLQTLLKLVSICCFSTISKPLMSTPPDAVTTHLPPSPRMKLHCGSTAFGIS